jgi:colanic acid/amylovoran biosynthesis glycosyltransferase
MKLGYILGLKQGIHRFIYRELCAMEEMGCEINIFTTKRSDGTYNPHDNWKLHSVSKYSGILMQIVYFLRQPGLYLKLLAEARKHHAVADFAIAASYVQAAKGLDLIHAHFGDRKLYVGYFLKKFTGIPLTVTIHAHELWRNPNWKMFKLAMAATDRIITISDFNKKYMVDTFQMDPNKIDVIKLYVDDDDIIPQGQKHILIVGSFEERKGYDTLLQAMALLKRSDYMVWAAGYGHMDIPGMAKQLGVADRIQFFGKIHADVLNILTMSCDFFCLPSKDVKMPGGGMDREGIPVAIMEAMAYSKPVISTRHVGIPELVEQILVDEDNPKQLAEAINYLLDHPEVYALHGAKNQQIIQEHFSKKNVHTLNTLFKKLSGAGQSNRVKV